jgi:ribosomal protein L18
MKTSKQLYNCKAYSNLQATSIRAKQERIEELERNEVLRQTVIKIYAQNIDDYRKTDMVQRSHISVLSDNLLNVHSSFEQQAEYIGILKAEIAANKEYIGNLETHNINLQGLLQMNDDIQEQLNKNTSPLPVLQDILEQWQTEEIEGDTYTYFELWEKLDPKLTRNTHKLEAARWLYSVYRSFSGGYPENKTLSVLTAEYPYIFLAILESFYLLQPMKIAYTPVETT